MRAILQNFHSDEDRAYIPSHFVQVQRRFFWHDFLSVLTLMNSLGDYDIEYDDDGVVNLTCENFLRKT